MTSDFGLSTRNLAPLALQSTIIPALNLAKAGFPLCSNNLQYSIINPKARTPIFVE